MASPSTRRANEWRFEFTRAMDPSDDREAKKDAEKKCTIRRCFGILQLVAGETGLDPAPVQLRGSISSNKQPIPLLRRSTLAGMARERAGVFHERGRGGRKVG
jgi:hypothetical protein